MFELRHMMPVVVLAAVTVVGCGGSEENCRSDADCPGRQTCVQSGGVVFGSGVCTLKCSSEANQTLCYKSGGVCENGFCINRNSTICPSGPDGCPTDTGTAPGSGGLDAGDAGGDADDCDGSADAAGSRCST